MKRWDWIRSIVGASSPQSEVSSVEVSLQVSEGFQSIATALQRFELEISTHFELMRGEFKAYGQIVSAQIKVLESRMQIVEGILFEPDPLIKEQKLEAARQSLAADTVGYRSHKQ